eukprot:271953_1
MLPRVQFNLGDSVQLSRDRVGVIKYIGNVHYKYGEWYGIELQNKKNGGKNNGSVKGVLYFQTKNNLKNGIFVRLHQIRYLIKRNQKNNKTPVNHIKKFKKSKKIKNRNYIKSIIKQTMNINNIQKTLLIPECKRSLVINIPKDVLKYNILYPYFHSFEKFELRMVCIEFNNIFSETQNILLSSIESDINYWANHSFSKYYKISPNYFSYLDLRHNRLSYLSKQEQIALKYFVIYNRNISNLLIDNRFDIEQEESKQDKIKIINPINSAINSINKNRIRRGSLVRDLGKNIGGMSIEKMKEVKMKNSRDKKNKTIKLNITRDTNNNEKFNFMKWNEKINDYDELIELNNKKESEELITKLIKNNYTIKPRQTTKNRLINSIRNLDLNENENEKQGINIKSMQIKNTGQIMVENEMVDVIIEIMRKAFEILKSKDELHDENNNKDNEQDEKK